MHSGIQGHDSCLVPRVSWIGMSLALWLVLVAAIPAQPALREPASGLLFFGTYAYRDNIDAVRNPCIVGAFFSIYWSDVEKQRGVFDWSAIDHRLQPWFAASKRAALRIVWSSSGYWQNPTARAPTPGWVWQQGARMALHAPSQTEIPLIWDPIYKTHAFEFLEEVARKFDGDSRILFLDVTPGAETNPYRFGTIDQKDPGFRTQFLATAASNNLTYSYALWDATIREWIDESASRFKQLPLLVTLNRGGMPTEPSRLVAFGEHAVSRASYVGQNGLKGASYQTNSTSKQAFLDWAAKTRLCFEMAAASGGTTGTLQEVMEAGERIRFSYLNVYPTDVLAGTRGYPTFQPDFEAALQSGAAYALKRGSLKLTPPAASVSRATGGPLSLPVDGGAARAGHGYVVLITLSGTRPGTVLGGTWVPINLDALTWAGLLQAGTPLFTGFLGTLDVYGRAGPTFVPGPGQIPGELVGFTFAFAVVTYDASGFATSAAAPVMIGP